MLLGSKSDLEGKREVTREDAEKVVNVILYIARVAAHLKTYRPNPASVS